MSEEMRYKMVGKHGNGLNRILAVTVGLAIALTSEPVTVYADEYEDTPIITEDVMIEDVDTVENEEDVGADAVVDDFTDEDVIISDDYVSDEVVVEDPVIDTIVIDDTVIDDAVTVSEDVVIVEDDTIVEDEIITVSDNAVSDEAERLNSPSVEKVRITLDGEYVELLNYNVAENTTGAFSYEVDKGSTITFMARAIDQGYLEAWEVEYVKVLGKSVTLKPNYIKDAEGNIIDTVHYYEIPDIQRDTTITVTRRARRIANGQGFTLINEAVHSQFVPASGISGRNGSYKFNNGASEFSFRVNSEGTYVPLAVIGHMEGDTFVEEGKWTYIPNLHHPVEQVNSTCTGTVRYYNRLPAYAFAGKVVKITEERKDEDRYFVVNTTNIEKLTARVNGRYFEVHPLEGGTEQQHVLYFPLFSRVTVCVTPKPYCKLTGAFVNYGRVTLSSANEFTFVVGGKGNLNIQAAGIPTTFIGDEACASGGKISRLYNSDEFDAAVYSGDKSIGNVLTLTYMTAKVGSRNAYAGFAEMSDDKKKVTINPGVEAGADVTVTLKGTDVNGSAFARSFIVSVTKRSTSISVKGFTNNVVNQKRGTMVNYAVTLSGKNVDYANLKMKADYLDGEPGIPNVTYTDKVLSVGTYTDNAEGRKLENRSIRVQFYYGTVADGNEVGSPFGIYVPDNLYVPAKPAITLSSASDIDAVLELTSAAADRPVSNLYYEVWATASGTPAAGMKGVTDSVYIRASDVGRSVKLQLADDEHNEKGKGVKQRYVINVRLVQVTDCKDDVAMDTQAGNIAVRGPVITKVIDTKNPSYETSIGIKGKTISFFRGQEVTLATVAFSAATSFTDFEAYIDGVELTAAYIEGNNIVLDHDYTDSLVPGKHTLTVRPKVNGAYASEKTLAFTVKQRIEDILLSVPTRKIYKVANKAASFTTSISYNTGSGIAPALKKVKWSICNKDGNPLDPADNRAKYITVKNGVVTIQARYVLSPYAYDEDNWITIKAEADDYAGNVHEAVSDPVLINNAYISVDDINIRKGIVRVVTARGSQIGELALYMGDTDLAGADITKSLTIKSNKPADFGYSPATGFYANKAGKYKLTVTANDGGKSSRTIDFEVQTTLPAEYKLYVGQGNGEWADTADVFGTGTTWNTNPSQYIVLEPKALGLTAGDYYVKPTIYSVSGASKVSVNGDKYIYTPTGKEIKVTVKTATGMLKYTINLDRTELTGKLNNVSITLNSGLYTAPYATGFSFDLKTVSIADGDYRIRFMKNSTGITASGVAADNYAAFYNLVKDINEVHIADGKATVYVPVDSVLNAGTYRVNAFLYRTEAGADKSLTNTAVLTFTVKSLGAPSMTLTSKYNLNTDNGYRDEIKPVSPKNIGIYEIYHTPYNVNKAGKVNGFADYYEIVEESVSGHRTWYLKLKDGVDPGAVPVADKTGYIRYSCANQSHFTVLGTPKYVMITVK